MLPALCGIRVSWCVCVSGLTVGGGVLRLGEEDGLMSAVPLLCLFVIASMCSDASGSDDGRLCMSDLHVSWGLGIGDKSMCICGCLFCVDMCES